MNDKEIGDSFYEYQKSLGELLVAVREMKGQVTKTRRAVEKVIEHPHLGAILALTHHTKFQESIR